MLTQILINACHHNPDTLQTLFIPTQTPNQQMSSAQTPDQHLSSKHRHLTTPVIPKLKPTLIIPAPTLDQHLSVSSQHRHLTNIHHPNEDT